MPREDREDRDDRDDDREERPRRKSGGGGGISIVLVVLLVLGGCLLLSCVAIGVGLLLPAVQKTREAAARMKDQNNMKQVSLAFFNQDSSIGMMSAPFARDDRNQVLPGLSWRVGLLPYIEQDSLYRAIDMKQSWDSAKNLPISNTIIPTYSTPHDEKPTANTPYRVFVGGGAMFEPDGKPIRLPSISDGTSNTILFVHATEQVPWAKPSELTYSPTAPLPNLGHTSQPNGTNICMADGSVRFLAKSTQESVVRALITRAGGETLPLDW